MQLYAFLFLSGIETPQCCLLNAMKYIGSINSNKKSHKCCAVHVVFCVFFAKKGKLCKTANIKLQSDFGKKILLNPL